MPTDREILNKAVAGLVGGSNELAADPLAGGAPANTTTGAARAMQRRRYTMVRAVAEPAATDIMTNGVGNNATVTYVHGVYVPHKSRLVDAKIVPMAALTSSNTTYATINVTKDNGGGGAQTVIFSTTTKTTAGGGTGSWAAGSFVNVTSFIVSTSGANDVDAGSYLQLQITKASTGVVVPVHALDLIFEEI